MQKELFAIVEIFKDREAVFLTAELSLGDARHLRDYWQASNPKSKYGIAKFELKEMVE